MHEQTGAIITDEMRDMIRRVRLAFVATVGSDGRPNLSPRGSLKVLDSTTLIYADIQSPQTTRNVEINPNVEINVVDPFRRRGFRFRGTAMVSEDVSLVAFAGADLGADYPVRHAVVIKVDCAVPVRSPVYSFTDATEEQIIETWTDFYCGGGR